MYVTASRRLPPYVYYLVKRGAHLCITLSSHRRGSQCVRVHDMMMIILLCYNIKWKWNTQSQGLVVVVPRSRGESLLNIILLLLPIKI